MNYSNPVLLAARRFGQRLGVLRPVVRAYRKLFKVSYEEKFDQYIVGDIRPSDVVWDVGANVGYFSEKFSEAVGQSGHVYAFEPAPETNLILKEKCSSYMNVTVEQIALADFDGESLFHVSGASADPTNGLGEDRGEGEKVQVRVCRGDTYLASLSPSQIPNCIKIDVEGYEYEVLKGLEETLSKPVLRALYMEIHFLILANRGMPDASTNISKLLSKYGFSLRWIDPSHLAATR